MWKFVAFLLFISVSVNADEPRNGKFLLSKTCRDLHKIARRNEAIFQ